MNTLAEAATRAALQNRIQRLTPNSNRKWGRMTAHQMLCHLNDSFRVGMGEPRACFNKL